MPSQPVFNTTQSVPNIQFAAGVKEMKKMFKPKHKNSSTTSISISTPKTMSELIDLLISDKTKGKSHRIHISMRANVSPGYYTKLGIEPDRIKETLVPSTYSSESSCPGKPSDECRLARLDESWIKTLGDNSSNYSIPRDFNVNFIMFDECNKTFFMGIQDAQIPNNNPKWTICGGLYPTNVTPKYHEHRHIFGSFNPYIKPLPCLSGTPCIGAFSYADNASKVSLKLDGKEIELLSI